VRGAHYPQDQRFLDLCDENGIAIWEETLGPGTKTSDFDNDYFMKYQLQVGRPATSGRPH
jgi:beta-glucuronidase